jgi:hypothetical protein
MSDFRDSELRDYLSRTTLYWDNDENLEEIEKREYEQEEQKNRHKLLNGGKGE